MGWMVAYFIVGIIILIAGFVCMVSFGDEWEDSLPRDNESPLPYVRYVSLWTVGSWFVAISWPLLLLSVVPGLLIYGTWTGIRAIKHKGDLTYTKAQKR